MALRFKIVPPQYNIICIISACLPGEKAFMAESQTFYVSYAPAMEVLQQRGNLHQHYYLIYCTNRVPACALCDALVEDTKNIMSCTAQVCVKNCLPPLHNYLEIDGIVPKLR